MKHTGNGEDTNQEFADFMAKHGEYFPENPQNVDELVDALARRAAAAQQIFNSLTPEQQRRAGALSQQAFGSPELMDQLSLDGCERCRGAPRRGLDAAQRFPATTRWGSATGNAALPTSASWRTWPSS
jgi:uncharacterized protein with von Willebrand factor type A (vWA) domain